MITALVVWLALVFPVAIIVGRAIKRGGQYVNLTEHCECGCALTDWAAENAS